MARKTIGWSDRVAGYMVAVLAGSATMSLTLLLWQIGEMFEDGLSQSAQSIAMTVVTDIAMMFFLAGLIAIFASIFAFLPAAVLILVGESLGMRARLYYAIAGLLAALCTDELYRALLPLDPPSSAQDMVILAISGFVGGLAYWSVTCRRQASNDKGISG